VRRRLGLDVAVHDATLVCVLQRARHVAEYPKYVFDGHGASGDHRAKRVAVDVRHTVVRQSIRLTGREHGDDVGLLQRRGELDLALEPLSADPGRELGAEHFDHDPAAQTRFVSNEHARHPATAELSLDGVRPTQVGLQLLAQIHEARSERAPVLRHQIRHAANASAPKSNNSNRVARRLHGVAVAEPAVGNLATICQGLACVDRPRRTLQEPGYHDRHFWQIDSRAVCSARFHPTTRLLRHGRRARAT
jgi:hypothetical protein